MRPQRTTVSVAVPVDDPRRQIGAIVDMFVSLGMFVLAVFAGGAIRDAPGEPVPLPVVVGLLVAAAVLDALVYAVPVSRWGWSIGGLIAHTRIEDLSGQRLSVRRAIRRYVARRNLFLWFDDSYRRRPRRSGVARVMVFVSGLATWVLASRDGPVAPSASHADRRVGSVVKRSVQSPVF